MRGLKYHLKLYLQLLLNLPCVPHLSMLYLLCLPGQPQFTCLLQRHNIIPTYALHTYLVIIHAEKRLTCSCASNSSYRPSSTLDFSLVSWCMPSRSCWQKPVRVSCDGVCCCKQLTTWFERLLSLDRNAASSRGLTCWAITLSYHGKNKPTAHVNGGFVDSWETSRDWSSIDLMHERHGVIICATWRNYLRHVAK